MQHYGIIGYPLEHTFSPTIHNTAFGEYNMDADYGKVEIEPSDFDKTISDLKKQDWRGFNVTIPYKQKVIAHLDSLEPVCERIGAVNTIKVEDDGRWTGYNTDYTGFIKPIDDQTGRLHNCLLIGAGGAAQAVGFGLLKFTSVKKLLITNRTRERGVQLINKLRSFKNIEYEFVEPDRINIINEKFGLIVNTTSVGMGDLKNLSPINLDPVAMPETIVYDLIYNPAQTRLLKDAARAGLKTVNGLPMLIGQAEESFRIWTGKKFTNKIINSSL